MNRREIIKSSARALVGMGGIALGIKATQGDPIDLTRSAPQSELHVTLLPTNTFMTFAPSSWRILAAQRIVNENGEMWLAVRDRYMGRNPILIAFDDEQSVVVVRDRNHWTFTERTLTTKELAGRDECRRDHILAFYSYHDRQTTLRPLAEPRIGQEVYDRPYRLRAWIKNGRRPEWQMSIDGFRQNRALAVL